MSSGSPTSPADHPYGHVRHHHGCSRIKFKPIKVNTVQKLKTTYLGSARLTQPLRNPPNHPYSVHTTWCQHGQIKFIPRNINWMETDGNAHLGCTGITQPCQNVSKCCCGVVGPMHQHGRIKIASVNLKTKCIDDKMAREDGKTHLEHIHTTQPLVTTPKHLCGVHRTCCRHGHIKSGPTNVSRTQNGGRTHLGHVNALRLIWRPEKQIRRVSKLTVDSRMPGEPWHNVDDHR